MTADAEGYSEPESWQVPAQADWIEFSKSFKVSNKESVELLVAVVCSITHSKFYYRKYNHASNTTKERKKLDQLRKRLVRVLQSDLLSDQATAALTNRVFSASLVNSLSPSTTNPWLTGKRNWGGSAELVSPSVPEIDQRVSAIIQRGIPEPPMAPGASQALLTDFVTARIQDLDRALNLLDELTRSRKGRPYRNYVIGVLAWAFERIFKAAPKTTPDGRFVQMLGAVFAMMNIDDTGLEEAVIEVRSRPPRGLQ